MIPKKKPTFNDYLKSGGWKKILKTSFIFGGVIVSAGLVYYLNLAFRSYKTQKVLTEGSALLESSERSSDSHRPYKFVTKSDAKYGQSLEFEMKEVNEEAAK